MQKSPIDAADRQRGKRVLAWQRFMLLGVTTVVTGSLFISACGLDIGLDRNGNLTINPQEPEDRNIFDEIGDGFINLFDDDDGDNFFDDLF